MKYVDIEKVEDLPGIRLEEGDVFHFQCHAGLACFNRCCRNLNLFLYPYDVLRLKRSLGVRSDQFLDRHVDVVLRPSKYFPDVLLRMDDSEEKTCPFLRETGCSVYPDRPDTCRTFPVEQGALYDAKTGRTRLVHFFRPPDFCLGRHEARVWTPRTWEQDQGAAVYHSMTLHWAEIQRLLGSNPWGSEGIEGPKGKMAFMAAYNLDRFREFVFQSSFLQRFKVKMDQLKKIERDEAALLLFGFKWIKLYLWGIKTKDIRPR
jgi:Fe-S-cluster containining protein